MHSSAQYKKKKIYIIKTNFSYLILFSLIINTSFTSFHFSSSYVSLCDVLCHFLSRLCFVVVVVPRYCWIFAVPAWYLQKLNVFFRVTMESLHNKSGNKVQQQKQQTTPADDSYTTTVKCSKNLRWVYLTLLIIIIII